MAAGARRLAERVFWLRVDDQVPAAHGVVVDGELEDPVEQQHAAVGATAVEAEHELVELVRQVGVVDGALVGARLPGVRQAQLVVLSELEQHDRFGLTQDCMQPSPL